MKLLTLLTATICLALLSCQKEVDFANGSNTGSGNSGGSTSSGALLVKMVQKTDQDSVVNLFAYDGNKKLINLKLNGIDNSTGSPVDREYRYYRNSSGILTQITLIDADLVSSGIDSAVTVVHYNTSTSQYSSYVINVNVPGFILLDSSVLVYDGAGKVIGQNVYESLSGTGTDYYLTGSFGYEYTNGNITGYHIHDLDQTGAEIFTALNVIVYDAKPNPLHFGVEAFAMDHPEWACLNNITSEQLSDSGGAADNQTVTTTYTYNSDNRPVSSIASVVPDNVTVNTSYSYQ